VAFSKYHIEPLVPGESKDGNRVEDGYIYTLTSINLEKDT